MSNTWYGKAAVHVSSPEEFNLEILVKDNAFLGTRSAGVLLFLDWRMGINLDLGIFTQNETILENPNYSKFGLYLQLLWEKKQMLKEA